MIGALVVNLTCDVRRVAKLPSEPRRDAYQIRQAKYVDSSHPNTRTSQGALGQGVAALQIHLCKGIVKSYRTPALHGLAPFPPTQSATKIFDFQSVQTLRTKLAESVDVPVERENQLSRQNILKFTKLCEMDNL